MASKELDLASKTLQPLPQELHNGLLAIFILATISFTFSFVLFIYLTHKLIVRRLSFKHRQEEECQRLHRDYFEERLQKGQTDPERGGNNDFTLGIDGMFSRTPSSDTKENMGGSIQGPTRKQTLPPAQPVNCAPNQFLVLIYNLLLADLHQSLAFMFNGQWLHSNGIIVGTPVCFTQGFFVSTGDLSSSMFITLIAIHTYLSVVKGCRPPQRILYAAIVFVWFFVYLVTILPIVISHNGDAVGGFMVRAVSWCWINQRYETARLLTQYLWIFIALVLTAGIYIAIWLHLRQKARSSTNKAGYNPVFLLYPIIYITCTLPLALGRILSMVNVELPMGYFCFAGAIISFNGFFDCILFSTTRHSIIFNSKYNFDDQDTGVNTISFLQTPHSRVYGNMIWIQGGPGDNKQEENTTGAGEWWSWHRVSRLQDSKSNSKSKSKSKPKVGTSQENLRGIHMDMITTVVVEVEDDDKNRLGRPPSETGGSEPKSPLPPFRP